MINVDSVITVKTKLAAVRHVKQGNTIGYGCSYRVPRKMMIGTISAGYADGLPLALSNRGHVLIRNRPCPILGRLSMDYTTVSLEQCPEACAGDDVICLGGSGELAVRVEDWAKLKGTHAYDIICSIGTRVKRQYLD